MNSRIKNKLDGGYVRNREEADAHVNLNAMGTIRPMLAVSSGSHLLSSPVLYVQPKLNGMRLLITLDARGRPIAYTRKGQPLETVEHILEDVAPRLYPGHILDGELYMEGESLQRIMSLAKRWQPETELLKFHNFDSFDANEQQEPFKYRCLRLFSSDTVTKVPTQAVDPASVNFNKLLTQTIAEGYEGLILRDPEAPYQPGKRAKGLAKVKQFQDAEFRCVDVTTGERGMAVLVCETATGQEFRVTAPGNAQEKRRALENPAIYVGQMVTVKYAEMTPYGIPFHPVCLGLRGD
jgi:DNA ligase-1